MEKNCLYCEAHFTTGRSNKKYCSDNCKQMAYFKRNGLVLSGGTKPKELLYTSPTLKNVPFVKLDGARATVKCESKEVKQESVKYVSQSPSEKHEKRENNSFVPVSEKSAENNAVLIESMLNRFMENMEQKFNQAIENAKQELAVKYGNANEAPNRNEMENTKEVCNPIAFNGIGSSQTKEKKNFCNPCEEIGLNTFSKFERTNENQKAKPISDFKEVFEKNEPLENQEQEVETAYIEWDEEKEDSETEEKEEEKNESIEKDNGIQELEDELRELKIEHLSNTSRPAQEDEIEEEYKWIESKIIKRIENNYVSQNQIQNFKKLLSYWNYPQLTSVSWINVRLRCLIESTIKLSNYSSIDKHTLLCITDAFNRLVKSNAFNMLPENYPFMDLIKDLCIKLNGLVRNNVHAEKIKFVLPLERKANLIALRHEMVKFIPAMKFSEMEFTEDNILHVLKTEDEPATKKSDWRIRYQAMKRAEQRKAA